MDRLFEEVSIAVDHGSGGEQVPWFADVDGTVGSFVLRPGVAASAPDPLLMDLRLAREAVECGLPVCLESAAAAIRNAGLRDELKARAAGLRGPVRSVTPAPAGRATPALNEATLTVAARASLPVRRRTVEGWVEVADRLLVGSDGFPRDETAALRWYREAAEAGSGAAAFATGSAHHRGIAGAARNEAEAYRWFLRAAAARHLPAFAVLGDYEAAGEGGRPKDEAAALKWFRAGMELGDGPSTRRYADFLNQGKGGLKMDQPQSYAIYRKAADLGDAEAMASVSGGIGYMAMYTHTQADPAQVFAWEMKAAKAGYLPAFNFVADDYAKGGGVAKDELESVSWRLQAAERGSKEAMVALAKLYEAGDQGLAGDCHQAGVWYRRAAVAGSSEALGRIYRGRDRYSQGSCVSLK